MQDILSTQYGRRAVRPLRWLGTTGGRLAMQLATADGQYVVKLTSPGTTRSDVERQVAALSHLARHDFPAPRPLRARSGATYLPYRGRFLYAYAYIAGTHPAPNEDLFRRLGALLARLHTLPSADYPHASTFTPAHHLPPARRRLARGPGAPSPTIAAELDRELDRFPSFAGLPEALIHADVRSMNLVDGQAGALHLLDFDTAGVAPALIDVGCVLARLCTLTARDRRRLRLADGGDGGITWRPDWARTFLTAYQQRRPLSTRERALLPHAASFPLLAALHDWDTGAFMHANYERYRLLARELPGLVAA